MFDTRKTRVAGLPCEETMTIC